jgi:hypothetical protein
LRNMARCSIHVWLACFRCLVYVQYGWSVPGHFAERHFAKRHFAEWIFCRRTFCGTNILTNELFAEKTFCQTDNLPKIEMLFRQNIKHPFTFAHENERTHSRRNRKYIQKPPSRMPGSEFTVMATKFKSAF